MFSLFLLSVTTKQVQISFFLKVIIGQMTGAVQINIAAQILYYIEKITIETTKHAIEMTVQIKICDRIIQGCC